MRVATIDIGSNSILLAIAERKGDGIQLLHDEAEIVGLSKKLSLQNEITPDALERGIKALQKYRKILDRFSPDKIICVTTEALRRASNGSQIRDKLAAAIGHPIEIIDGDREAELSFWSVQKDYEDAAIEKIVFDIGGASTELCKGNHLGVQDRTSLKFGGVVLTEKFGLDQPSTKQEILPWLEQELKALSWAPSPLGVGVAGTVTSLIALHFGITNFHRDRVHKKTIDRTSVEKILDQVLSLSIEDRRKVPGMPPKRADVIGAGISIVLALMYRFNWSEITCMDAGVRFGLLYENISGN